MTNAIYFNIYRDDDSCSTTSSNEIASHLTTNLNHPSSPSSLFYSLCLACAKPQFQSEDNNTDVLPSPTITAPIPPLSGLRNFSNKEIKTATRNFCFRFGPVFKGWIHENSLAPMKPGKGTTIVVKKLSNKESGFNRIAELNSLGKLNHCNLVKLFGYCAEGEECLLVYEFMPRGSLDNHLFRKGSGCLLSWSVRMKVALGAAKGLAFLHSSDVNVIHGNYKSSHILLDSEYNAKISYLGSASHGPDHEIDTVRNPGYTAVADSCAGHPSTKNDIYNFGVVLLELLSGRRATANNLAPGEKNLVEWAKYRLLHKRGVCFLLDSNLQGQCSGRSGEEAAQLAFQCVTIHTSNQLNMMGVVRVLEGLQESEGPKTPTVNKIQTDMNIHI